MADVFVQEADNDLTTRLNLFGATVNIRYPVEGLLWWRDVIAHGCEQDDWRPDVAQIEAFSAVRLNIAGPQLVADEEIACDPLNLFAIHQVVAAPPSLKLQKT